MRPVRFGSVLRVTVFLMSTLVVFHLTRGFTAFVLGYFRPYMLADMDTGFVTGIRPSMNPSTLWILAESFVKHEYSSILNSVLRPNPTESISLGLAIAAVCGMGLWAAMIMLNGQREMATRIEALIHGEYMTPPPSGPGHPQQLHALEKLSGMLRSGSEEAARHKDEEDTRISNIAAEVGALSATVRGYAELLLELADQGGRPEQMQFAKNALEKMDRIDELMGRL